MRRVVPASSFRRAYKHFVAKHPSMQAGIQIVLEKLSIDPFQPSLETHKLKGKLKGSFACSAGYDLRIVFDFTKNDPEDDILLIEIGTHDEVY